MICEFCRTGGALNRAGADIPAAIAHAQCESPNCPCQHRAGTVIKTGA